MNDKDIVSDFRYYFDFPLSFDGMYIRDDKGEKVILMLVNDYRLANHIVDKINGSQKSLPGDYQYHRKTQIFTKYGKPIMEMKGHLHLKLNHCVPEHLVKFILDDFADYIVKQIYRCQ